MKFTLSWLKEYLDTEADVDAVAERLTAIGLEVEAIEDPGARLKDFSVAEIITAEKHPNADKLQVCTVNSGTDMLQIVCGAPNARAGLKVVLAKPGTVIPSSGQALKIGSIRGVESRGMLCSAAELMLSEEAEGIIELPEDVLVGSSAAAALGMTDPVIDVSLTPNRGDCTAVAGIARDLAASGLGRLRDVVVRPVPGKFKSPIGVELVFPDAAASACPVFAGRLVRGVKNGPSPQWLQDRLRAVGLRPISALVDITNLISLDRGRPLHVFDADKLSGTVRARLAKDGETLLALDEKTYTLDSEMCVIADDAAARGIAGVMGGVETGCTGETVNVFIESAYFDPARTAATGRKLGILSDARYRFERGVDPAFVIPGLELATKLVLEFCGGEPSEIVVAGAPPDTTREIQFDPKSVRMLAGLDVPRGEVVSILTRLGFSLRDGTMLTVKTPTWRSDIAAPADLVEEVVRIYGIDRVPSAPLPRVSAVARPTLTSAQRRTRTLRRVLAARGFNETISYSFIAREQAKLFGGGDDARQLANPIAADLDAMRPSLLPSLLAAAARNMARGASDLMLFEIGAQFQSGQPEDQSLVAAGIRTGGAARHWSKATHAADAFDVKADILSALEGATGSALNAPIKPGATGWYHPGRSGTLALGPKTLAMFGEIHPAVLAAFDITVPVAGFEIFLDALPVPKAKGPGRSIFAPSPYQAIERDFAFVVEAGVAADDLVRAVKNAERNLIDLVSVFDVYEGKGVPKGMKSLAISVRLAPRDKTLTDAEIEAIAAKIVAAATKATGATLRT